MPSKRLESPISGTHRHSRSAVAVAAEHAGAGWPPPAASGRARGMRPWSTSAHGCSSTATGAASASSVALPRTEAGFKTFADPSSRYTAPALPPAAAIWLVPFVALTGIRWRDHLLWAGAEAVHAVAYHGHLIALADPAKGLPPGWYALALSLRLLAVGWVAHQAWVAASWGDAAAAGTLVKLPSERPVENHGGPVGSSAYPPVTERP